MAAFLCPSRSDLMPQARHRFLGLYRQRKGERFAQGGGVYSAAELQEGTRTARKPVFWPREPQGNPIAKAHEYSVFRRTGTREKSASTDNISKNQPGGFPRREPSREIGGKPIASPPQPGRRCCLMCLISVQIRDRREEAHR